ncbi:CU044_5270 family protein [Actinoplanes sichuanensis]|uniref:CU044_5270 family protein n=1 Tax=Actinoplanes sichuanensis TaxID=512349 RepID=A0ABW4ADX3_9ACTN|nr:CU044_5270 family protein [Actinoplanes sichuanensis]BEL06990.1 CU044_5270 family protein [Actinoplanes sichuanensis]
MSDLIEQQLRDLFAADADAAPRPADLLTRTRRAARAQRLRTGAWALAASVVAVTAGAFAVWPSAPEPVPFPQVAAPPTDPVRAPGTLSATPGYGPGTRLSMRPVAQVLDLAAGTAAKAADVVPEPGQFLYTRTVGRDGRILAERWYSIDGAHDGLGFNVEPGGVVDRFAFPGCRDGRQISGPDRGGPCEADPAYLPDLPEDAESMAGYLDLSSAHLDDDPAENKTNGIAKDMWTLGSSKFLRPAQRAALFQATARIPGITVVDDAVDAAGRTGTGVTWTFGKHSMMWIFDPKTHDFLGSDVDTTEQAVVDEVGERPAR